jgi:glycosyltransferase involved in cell wall biosynthesis
MYEPQAEAVEIVLAGGDTEVRAPSRSGDNRLRIRARRSAGAAGHPGPPAGIAPGSSFILAFASADGRKNHATAIEAYDVLAPEFPNLKLALVCSHPQVRDGIKRPHDSGVIPVGPVSLQELIWLYRNALALVFPSFDEGFGLPPLEAMACGTPVVVSKAGSLPEVVGDCAVFADPCDAAAVAEGLKLVLTDGHLRSGLVSAGREHAARFSRENTGRELIAAYSQAASGAWAAPAPA